MGLRSSITGQRRSTTPIVSPALGVLNLAGPAAMAWVREDIHSIGYLFASLEESEQNPPHCDVLMVYCQIDDAGSIRGTDQTLRHIIRSSGASIVVLASENSADACIAAARDTGYGRVNLVMTLDRKGAIFADFFQRLFDSMFKGKSMPVAWVDLAPQVAGDQHKACPETIFACELGGLSFKRR